jgi:hypothetical protein
MLGGDIRLLYGTEMAMRAMKIKINSHKSRVLFALVLFGACMGRAMILVQGLVQVRSDWFMILRFWFKLANDLVSNSELVESLKMLVQIGHLIFIKNDLHPCHFSA